MYFKSVIVNLFIMLIIIGCNTTEQTSVEKGSSTEKSVKIETFNYNDPDIEFVQNTTNANILPSVNLDGYYFQVLPALPAGLKINTTTGEISGIPTATLTVTEFLVEATSSTDTEYAFIKITVIEEPPKTISYQYSNLTFNKDIAGSFPAITTGGTVATYSVDPALPTGLTLDGANGDIGGTPTVPVAGTYNVLASNSSGSVGTALYIEVKDAAPSALSYSNDVQSINVLDPFVTMVPALSTNPTSVSYSVLPQLPSGIVLNSDGSISGSPTQSLGITSYLLTAYNTSGSSSVNITLTVNDPARSLTYPIVTLEVQQGKAISPIAVQSYLGGIPVTYACGACPTGITVNANTGLISGTTSDAIQVLPITITATHAATATNTAANITLNIVEAYPNSSTDMGYASDYTLYQNQVASLKPGVPGGMPTSYIINPNISTTITGLAFNTTTGEISGTPTVPITTTLFTIQGYNLDETSTPVLRSTQSVNITVNTLSPTMLGYLPTTSPFYNGTTSTFELQDGSNVALDIQPNITAGGLPTSYSISPQLPDGLVINPITGVITGVPNEIKPVQYFTITGTNTSGSFSETIAISTNTLIAPVSLSYGSGTNILAFTIFTPQIENPSYVGSQGTYTVSPSLPTGLSINSQTGQISGTPIIGYAGTINHTITVTNLKGTLSQVVAFGITNTAPANLIYEDTLASTNIIFTDGDLVDGTDIIHKSDYDNNFAAGFITTYTEIGTLDVDGTFGITLNGTSGIITGTATPTDINELNPAFRPVQIDGTNAIGSATANFNLKIIEKAPSISYSSGSNVILVQGTQTGTPQVVTATNAGGQIALTNGGVPGSYCTAAIQGAPEESYDIDAGNFAFAASTCSFTFNGNQCFNDDTGTDGTKGGSIGFSVLAQNSGNTAGVSTGITVNFYDGPNFQYEPDSEFSGKAALVLDGSVSGQNYTPNTTARCHEGDYTLTTLSDLPTPFTFNATDGTITNNGQNILGKRNFTLSAVETNSGLNLSQSETVSVQANHIENNTGNTFHKFSASKFDINLDGFEDIIIRNTDCDDTSGNGSSNGTCGAASVSTSIYLQSSTIAGLLQSTLTAAPIFSTANAVAFTPVQYDVAKAGVIYVSDANTNVITRSTTDSETATTALATAGFVRGITPSTDGVAQGFGVIIDTGSAIAIDQYTITGGDMSTIASAATPTVTVLNDASGGIDLGTGAVQIVTYDDTDNDGNMDVVIGYVDQTDSNKTKICILKSDGSTFQDTCSPRLEVPNTGNITEIKFADISGDTLKEMVILANDGTNNTIYVYENQNASFSGLYSAIDLITLNSNSSFVNFDLADSNQDGVIDIVTNDLAGDIDGDLISDTVISGLSVYYNTGNPSNLYDPTITTAFPTSLHYSMSSGDNNDIEILNFGSTKLIFACQIDTDNNVLTTSGGATITSYRNSSCGIIGNF